MSIEKPIENWTKFPNCILDNLDKIENASFKILSYMIRQTLGFQREYHRFSYSYLSKNCGVKGKETISKSLKNLINLGLITKLNESEYQLNWVEPKSSEIEQFGNRTPDHIGSSEIELELSKPVQKSNTLKENIKESENLKKSDYSEEMKIIDYYNSKNSGQAEPANSNKSTLKLIRATLNKYSYSQLISAIDNMYADQWAIDNKHIRLNRLISSDKRDSNIFRYSRNKLKHSDAIQEALLKSREGKL